MILRNNKTILFLLILLCACTQPSEFFIGKWQILNVVQDNESIELIENWMHLKSNGSFESYNGELKKMERGRWKYQPEANRLTIDGVGEEGDSYWKLSLRNDTLIFQSTSDDVYLISKKTE